MTVSVHLLELTCVEHSTWIGCAWCTILSRRPPSISHASLHLPADEGASHDSNASLLGLTCVEHSTRIGSAWCTILSRRPPTI